MNSAQMVQRVKDRTHHNNDDKIIGELNSAKDWAWTKIFNSASGPDLLLTLDTEKTMSAQTRTYDIGANVTGTLYGIKQLWLKFSSETNFTPMVARDMNDSTFRGGDQYPSSDTTSVAIGHPVLYEIINFSQARFSPPLPTSSVIRIDAWIKPPDIDPVANPTLTYANDLPEPAFEAVLDKATANIFSLMDDDRAGAWNGMAEQKLADAMYLMRNRNQAPVMTSPYRTKRRRWV